jgi:hypothetical protein
MRLCVSSYSMDLQLHSLLVFHVITKSLDATCVCEVCHRLLLSAVTIAGFLGHILQTGVEYRGSPCLCGTKLYSKIPTLVAFKTISVRACSK